MRKLLKMRNTLLAILMVASIAMLSTSALARVDNDLTRIQAQSGPDHLKSYTEVAEGAGLVVYTYPRYRPEMDAGQLADEIEDELGLKLKADFEGDATNGSVTVTSSEVIILMPELSEEQKQVLDEIVRNHYSDEVARWLSERPTPPEPSVKEEEEQERGRHLLRQE